MGHVPNRRTLRLGHLIEGALLSAYVYTPLGDWDPGRLFVQVAVVPAIAATGLLMWKLPALRARARRRATAMVHA
jgi:hypothetical protein